jgi:flagellar biogenesis protein FliO
MPFTNNHRLFPQITATRTVKCICGLRLLAVLLLLYPITAFSQQPRGNPSPTGEPALVRPPGFSVQPTNGSTSTPTRTVEYRFQDSNTGLPQANHRAVNNSVNSPVQPASFTETTRLSQQQTTIATSASTSQPSKLGSMPLKPSDPDSKGDIKKPTNSIGSFLGVIFSMGIVISLFLGLAWVYKKSLPKSMGRLPHEVVQVLGRTSISPRQQMYVVRFGKKLLLVSQQPGQTQTLSEISDDEEVDRLTGICESHLPSSATQSFSDVLRQVATGQRSTDRRRSRTVA